MKLRPFGASQNIVRQSCSAGGRSFRHGGTRNVFCASGFEDLLSSILFVAVLRIDRDKIITRAKLVFVAFSFDLRNSQSDQGPDETTSSRANRGATQCSHNRSGGDKRS